jgi:hypothetical protein
MHQFSTFLMFLVYIVFYFCKVKVTLSLCFSFTWAPRHEGVLGEWRYSSTHSLTSAPDGGKWSASRPGRFTPRGRAPGTHLIGGWVGPRAILDVVVKRKIPSPRQESNPRTPIVQSLAQRYTDWVITALCATVKVYKSHSPVLTTELIDLHYDYTYKNILSITEILK